MQKLQISNNIQINVKVTPIIEKTAGYNATVEKETENLKLLVTKSEYDTVAESITEKMNEIVAGVTNKEDENEAGEGGGSGTAYFVWVVIAGLLIIIIIICIWTCYR